MDDPLKKLLEQTGWSYEDVLSRLEQYKQTNVTKTSTETNRNDCDNATISKTNSTEENSTPSERVVINVESVETNFKKLNSTENSRKRRISDEATTEEISPVCVKVEGICASSNENESDEKNEKAADCKKIRLSSPTDVSASNDSICHDEITEPVIDKLESAASDHIEECYQITSSEQIKEENEEPEANKLVNIDYDKEDTTECEQSVSDRLKDIDEIKEESEAKCENQSIDNDNSQCGIITNQCRSRRKSDLKNCVETNRLSEETIQEDKRDNNFSTSTSNSMKDLTKSLNKRRKLSDTDESNHIPSVSDLDDSNNKCDNIIHSTIEETTKSPESPARENESEDTFTNRVASDETDSNKENADLDFNCKEQRKTTKTQNTLEENLNKKNSDLASIPYSPIIREDTFFDEAKSRYFDTVKLKNKQMLSKYSFLQNSEDTKNAQDQQNSSTESTRKISDPLPDYIEMLKQEVCKDSYKMKDKKKITQKSQVTQLVNDEDQNKENPLKNDDDQLDTSHCSNQKTEAVEPKHGVGKLRNIINMISKKLQIDGIEDDSAKIQPRKSTTSSSSSSSSSNQDLTSENQHLKNSHRKHQVLILKRKKSIKVNSNLKTYPSDPPNIGASTSSSSISNKITTLTTKKSRTFNTDRLTSITNILSQKLSNISKDQDSKQEASDDELNLKIVDVVGGYKSPSPDVDYTKIWPYRSNPQNHIQNATTDLATTSKSNEAKYVNTDVVPVKIDYTPHSLSNISTVGTTVIDKLSTMQSKTNETAIKPTKTKDVTKIKGWKKKKFAVESPENVKSVSTINVISPLPGPSQDASCSSTSQTHSAFTSDILDEYLTQNADLKISYEVPKLDAEQTLQQTYADIKFPERQQEIVKTPKIQERKDKKPKTLAEKRKMEERPASRVLEGLLQIDTPTNKQYSTMVLKLKQRMLNKNVPFSRKSFVGSSRLTNTESFIMYNNKKIIVPSSKPNKVLCKLFHKESVPRLKRPKKLSLLKSLSNEDVFYDPKEWETVVKQLPKVYLEFIPTIGKRLHPKISHLIESNETILNRQRVNFALTVLKAPAPVPAPPKRFLFRIPYRNNQRSVSLRRRIIDDAVDVQLIVKKTQVEETGDDAVKHVVDKMLDYLDVLEETKDIIREDDAYDTVECKPIHAKKKQEEPKKVKFKEFKRTAFEMRRLNCKFVSISTEDENDIKKPCLKDHCRLGCVCASIEGGVSSLLETHCGLYKCMFQCTCKKDTFQHSSVFSEGIINRLQDEATKNLAKVEKEFTQTIIQTNNQLIVVGDSTERKKRVARAPKKYNDFVEDDLFYEEMPKKIATPAPTKFITPKKLVYKNHVFEACYVKLFNYNFKDIIPFCMEHLLYKCKCQYESSPSSPVRVLSQVNENPMPPASTGVSQDRPKLNKNVFDKERHTSRTRGISSSVYMVRNKTKMHLAKIEKTSKLLERQLNIYLKENADEIMFNDNANNTSRTADRSSESVLKNTSDTTSTNRRSTNIEVVDSPNEKESDVSASPPDTNVEKELKIQRRRMKQSVRDSSVVQKIDSVSENQPYQIQQSEKEFCMFLAKHNSQVRILPWSVLLSRYESGSFQLWTLNAPNAPVLLTENGKRPTLRHCNVKLFRHLSRPFDSSCDIIRYIINKQTPLGKSKDQVWVLFLETSRSIWRICGICDKSESKKNFSISIIALYGRLEDIIKESEESNNGNDNIVIDGNKTITSIKRHYLPKMLLPQNDENIDETVWASVPNITSSCKWRVISLQIPFAHLSFSRCKYTIEFNDIVKAIELTRPNNLTLALRSQDLHKTYPHKKFGIYCDYRYEDKIFVGPYFADENDDLTFLIIKNNMWGVREGTEVIRSGHWYRQAAPIEEHLDDDVELIPDDTALIDLTTDSDNEQVENNCAESETNVFLKTEASDLDSPDIDLDSKEKRYIVTNVPGIGYISAAVHKDSNYLDIVCPITHKIKTFIHAPSAIETLQRILVRKFILVPHTFKLKIKMIEKISGKKFKPLKSSILNGYHMVGEFGVRNASTVTVQDLGKFGLTNVEVLQVLEQRERKLLLSPLTTLSKLLNVFIPNKAPFVSSVHSIAEAAQDEVDHLHNEEANYIDQTFRLHETKKSLTKQCLQLVVNLPPHRRKEEQTRLHRILKSHTSRVDQMMNETSVLLKAVRSKTSNDDLGTSTEFKNLFDETVKKTSNNLSLSPSSTCASLLPMPKRFITRKPANSEDKPVLISASKVTASSSAINTSVPEINKNLKLINNTVLKHKQGTSLLKSADKDIASGPIQVLDTPVVSKMNTSGPPTSTSTSIVKSPPHIKVAQNPTNSVMVVTLPPKGAISTVKIGKSTYLAHNNQQESLISPKNSDATNNSMATLTPLKQSAVKNGPPANKPNYIALKNGDKLRYFQLVSEQKKLSANKVATTKQSDSVIKKSAKKIILSSALPINSDQSTAK